MKKKVNRNIKIPMTYENAVAAFLTVKPEPKKPRKKRIRK